MTEFLPVCMALGQAVYILCPLQPFEVGVIRSSVVEKMNSRQEVVRSIAKVIEQVVMGVVKSDPGKNESSPTSGRKRDPLLYLKHTTEVISWSYVVASWEVPGQYAFSGSSLFLMALEPLGSSTSTENAFGKYGRY